MPNIGPLELVVVLVVALLVLGPKKLPDAGRALGQGIRGFKDSLTGVDQQQAAIARPEDGLVAAEMVRPDDAERAT